MAEDNREREGPSGGIEIDHSLPERILKTVREEQPYKQNWSEDLKILLDPNVKVRSMVLPMVGTFRTRNHDYRYRWVYIKRGSNPDSSRYQQVKAYGFENATAYDEKENPSGDVEVLVADIGQHFTEIFSGDRILMKCPRAIYDGLIKQHMLDSIRMTTQARNGRYQDVDPGRRVNTLEPSTMRSADFGVAPMSRTDFACDRSGAVDVEEVMQRATGQNTVVVHQPGRK